MEKDIRINEHTFIGCPESTSMGDHIAIDWGFYCTTPLELKDWIHIGPYCTIIGGKTSKCTIGNFVGIAAGCRIICASDDYSGEGIVIPFVPTQYRKFTVAPVVVEDYVTLGTNVIVMPGVTLAEGTAVGAGAIITRSTEPWGFYFGSPARKMKTRSKKLLEYAKEMGYGAKYPD